MKEKLSLSVELTKILIFRVKSIIELTIVRLRIFGQYTFGLLLNEIEI